jgi:hypothetical protein
MDINDLLEICPQCNGMKSFGRLPLPAPSPRFPEPLLRAQLSCRSPAATAPSAKAMVVSQTRASDKRRGVHQKNIPKV